MEAAVAAGAAWAKSAASLSTSSALSPDVASPRVCSSVFSSATCTHGRFGSGSGYPPSSSRPRGAQGGVASVPGFGIRVWSPSGRMLHGVTLSLLSAVKVIAASRPACRKDLLAAATTSGEARERRSPPPRPNADEQRGAAEDARRGSEVRTARIVTHEVSIEIREGEQVRRRHTRVHHSLPALYEAHTHPCTTRARAASEAEGAKSAPPLIL